MEESVRRARKGCVLFDLSDRNGLIAVEGPDALTFLNNLTSNYVSRLSPGQGNRNALLTKKSTIVADFDLFHIEDHLLLHLDGERVKLTLEHLENFIFAEDVTSHLEPAGTLAIAGMRAEEVLKEVVDEQDIGELPPYGIQRARIAEQDVYIARRSLTGDPGWLILTYPDELEPVEKAILDAGAEEFDDDIFEILRIEAGELKRGIDYDENTLLLELNLGEKIFSLNKGCYPGQEVVARVVNRGKIPRKLMGVIAPGHTQLKPGMTIEFEGKSVGETKSCIYSPSLKAPIAIANLKRDVADDGAEFDFTVDGQSLHCSVVRLPFYESPALRARAEALYTEGMQHYHANQFEDAEATFKQAIEYRDTYADAWEALAMTVEKMGNIDEAIILNRKFAELDPNAVMARSNLSRLYMFKGFKDKAEEEMGKAQAIEFRIKLRERMGGVAAQKAMVQQRKEAEKAEIKRKMATFRQVLKLDPDDEIAHFGLGKLHLEIGQAMKAIEHLEIVISNNGEYSAAYELLAKAEKTAGNIVKAIKTLERGISVAEDRGDLMPAKAMKQLLAELSSG